MPRGIYDRSNWKPWNKGLTIEDSRVRTNVEAMRKTIATPEFRGRRSATMKKLWQDKEFRNKRILALNNPIAREKHRLTIKKLYGQPKMQETRRQLILKRNLENNPMRNSKIKEKHKIAVNTPKFKELQRERMKKLRQDAKFNEKVRIATCNPQRNEKIRLAKLGKLRQKSVKEKLSKVMTQRWRNGDMKRLWQNDEYREKSITAILQGNRKRPTSLEIKAIKLHQNFNLPFTYCGDGTLLIGYKNPDFYENNGKKICLEYANRYFHSEDYESTRIEHFKRYGWKCLVIWEDELEDESNLLQRINNFLSENK